MFWVTACGSPGGEASSQKNEPPVLRQADEPVSDDAPVAPTEPAESTDVAPELGPAPTASSPSEATPPQEQDRPGSPIDRAFGVPTDPQELSDAYGAAYAGWSDDVTTCLRAQGFDYTEASLVVPAAEEFTLAAQVSTTEVLSEIGYGISFNLEMLWGQRKAVAPAYEGPTFLESLSPAARDKFRLARGECMESAAQQNPLPDDLPQAVMELVATAREDIASSPQATGRVG